MLFNFLRIKGKKLRKKYGGKIAFLKLSGFWDSLLPEEREFIRQCSALSLGGFDDPKYIDSPEVEVSTTQTASSFLWIYADWAIGKKKFELADKLLNESITRSNNAIDLHFTFNHFIKLFYKRRDESPEWIERCIRYCRDDIALFPRFKKEYVKERVELYINLSNSQIYSKAERKKFLEQAKTVTFNLFVPSFQRLAIIFERQGRYQEAIEVCNLALDYGLEDNTKSGYAGRIERLKKKYTGKEQAYVYIHGRKS